jgi:hypothetical protein
VGPRAVLDVVVRKIPGPHWESNPRTPVGQPVTQCYTNFASFNSLCIMNAIYQHEEIHKITWAARGYNLIIFYFLGNEKKACISGILR